MEKKPFLKNLVNYHLVCGVTRVLLGGHHDRQICHPHPRSALMSGPLCPHASLQTPTLAVMSLHCNSLRTSLPPPLT